MYALQPSVLKLNYALLCVEYLELQNPKRGLT